MSDQVDVVVAEDDETDAFLLKRAFKDAGEAPAIRFVNDGRDLIQFLETTAKREGGRLPALILLDLKMPRVSGMDVLEWRRQQPVLGCIPVIVFSSSLRDEDIERCYALGASMFMSKPNSTTERVENARFVGQWLKLGRPPLAATAGYPAAERAHEAFGLPPNGQAP